MTWSSAPRLLPGIRHPIRQKLMLMIAAVTLIALLVTGAAMVAYDLRNYQESWASDLTTQAEILGRASAPALAFDDRKVAAENLSLLSVRSKIRSAALYTAKGDLFATYTRDGVRGAPIPARPEAAGIRREGDELVGVLRIVDRNAETLGTVYLRAEYEVAERLATFLKIIGVIIAISLAVAVWVSTRLQSAITGPVLEITEVAQKVREQRDFSLRARKTSEDEIGYLVETFNEMLAEVGRRTSELESSHRSLEHEMTVRRAAEESLRVADRLKDEFIATLAHELRNPLAPMRNSVELLRLRQQDPAIVAQAREIMERQLRQLVRLVDDLLDVSRITTGKLALQRERVDLDSIIERALEQTRPLVASRVQRVRVELPRPPVVLNADPTRLAQVFTNLINNAAKFSARGADITLKAAREGGEVVVSVADTGIGIAKQMLPAIFQMFVQVDRRLEREHAGLGVGLSLARHLVELHGGAILAESAGEGRGSTFTVRLPTAETAAVTRGGAAAATESPGAAKRILLADDNEDFASSMATMLEAFGHEVCVANDGPRALAEAADFRPDFAFLDIGLPGLNGYDLARELRALPLMPRPILVAITGWGQESYKQRARDAGFDHHLVKPVEIQQIREILGGTAHG